MFRYAMSEHAQSLQRRFNAVPLVFLCAWLPRAVATTRYPLNFEIMPTAALQKKGTFSFCLEFQMFVCLFELVRGHCAAELNPMRPEPQAAFLVFLIPKMVSHSGTHRGRPYDTHVPSGLWYFCMPEAMPVPCRSRR